MGVLDKIMGVNEAAEKWGFSPDHVKKLCRDGDVYAVKIGKTWVIEKNQEKPKRKRK